MDLTIYIPTRGRTGISKQITVRTLRDQLKGVTPIIVCPMNEVAWHNYSGVDVYGCPMEGIGPTRQWILDTAKSRGVIMLDDDMYFSERSPAERVTPLVQTTNLRAMIQWISDTLDQGFVHGGISARQGNQNIPHLWTDNIRVNNAHFFDAEVFKSEGIRFDRIPVMEDFDVSLQLIHKGYPNRVAYQWCWNQRGSGKEGGCSAYRTLELQAEAANKLHNYWPDVVEVIDKVAQSGGSVFAGVTRKDVKIAWQKAWEMRRPVAGAPNLDINMKRR